MLSSQQRWEGHVEREGHPQQIRNGIALHPTLKKEKEGKTGNAQTNGSQQEPGASAGRAWGLGPGHWGPTPELPPVR